MPNSIYEDIEDAVVSALSVLREQGFEVEPMPDNDKEFKRALVKGRFSVIYHSSKPSEQMSLSGQLSKEMGHVQILLESRSRRGAGGIFNMKSLADPLINGLVPTGWTLLEPGTFEFAKRDESVWTYNWILKTEAVSMQAYDNYPYQGIDLQGY